jgi:hypothetical protein
MTHPRKPPPSPRDSLLTPVVRWDKARKAKLCQGIIDGVIGFSEACSVHKFSADELSALVSTYQRGGVKALRMTAPGLRRGAE